MMNKAYKAMREFWLDVNNLQHKKEVPQLGVRKICVAGVEIAATDTKGGVKNLMIAASSLGNASVYFENNSASGLGGFTGGSSSGAVREKALRLMQAAATVAEQLTPEQDLPEQQNPEMVTLFAVGWDGQKYATQLKDTEARNPENPLYPFFAYTQQLLGAFRAEQESAKATQPEPEPSESSVTPVTPAEETEKKEN